MKANTVGNLAREVFALVILKPKKYLRVSGRLFLIVTAMVLVIGGLNMTAKRMSLMVPQLPEHVIYAAKEADMVYLDILGQEFQIRLPRFLGGDTPLE
jgi:hypothetical protein